MDADANILLTHYDEPQLTFDDTCPPTWAGMLAVRTTPHRWKVAGRWRRRCR